MKLHLKNKKLTEEKLLPFGFKNIGENYLYTTDIVDGQFTMTVAVATDGTITTQVMDKGSNEEYVLHLMSGAAGSFVGRVREEYETVINNVIAKCYKDDIFQSEYAKMLIEYVRNTYGGELEFLWKKFPDNAIWRRQDNQKWYAALLTVSKRKLGLHSDEVVEIIDLRMKPDDVQKTVDNQTYFPGWHMNKKHWITIILDGSVEINEICRRLDDSYQIAGSA